MKKYIRIVSGVLVALALIVGLGAMRASAETTDSTAVQIQALLQKIVDLKAQIAALQGQQSDLRGELHDTVQLTRDLARGMSGDDVKELQALLASDPEIYPQGFITGFYGPLTEAAIARWQAKFGVEEGGRVGPQTRLALNMFWRHGGIKNSIVDEMSTSTPGVHGQKVILCHKPAGEDMHTLRIAPPALHAHLAHGDELGECSNEGSDDDDNDDANDDANDDDDSNEESVRDTIDEGDSETYELLGDDYEITVLSITDENDLDNNDPEVEFRHDGEETGMLEEGDEFKFDDGLEIKVKNIEVDGNDGEVDFVLSAEKSDDDDDDSTTLEISHVDEDNIDTDSATIMWKTNEESDSTVWYGTSTPVHINDDEVNREHESGLTKDHDVLLEDLEENTLYYYFVVSRDDEDNTATSSTHSFTTDEE